MHVVKEPFTLDGVDYPLGAKISDPAIAAKVLAQAPTHVVRTAAAAPVMPSAEPDDHAE